MRSLPPLLESIAIGETETRAPSFRVWVYDLRSSTVNTINDIVDGSALEAIVGPVEWTNNASILDVSEVSGDYASGGIASQSITVTLEDPDGSLDPFLLVTDSTADARFFRKGNVVRIYEGDEQVDSSLWPLTFTMEIAGQPGYIRSRAVGNDGVSRLQFKCVSREASFLGYEEISREYTSGETYRAIGEDVATSVMGLRSGELNFSGWGETRTLRHTTMTLSGESPIVLLARVMFVDGFIPRFDGDGKLSQHLSILGGNIDRFYSDQRNRISIGWPLSDIQVADSVVVKGLDFNQSRVDILPRQVVAKVNLTTGYFTQDEAVEALFSPDKTQLADNPTLLVKISVNGGFTILGGGETITLIPAPNDANEGYIGVNINISTGYAPWLATFLLATYVGLSFVPNKVVTTGVGVGVVVSTGFTINFASVAAAIALGGAMMIMTALGRGVYEIWADPFQYVFQEIRRRALADDADEFTKNEIEVLNHLIDDAVTCETLAEQILYIQQAGLHPRDVTMLHDLALEPADVFSSTDDDRVYLIQSVSRVLTRDDKAVTATIRALELTSGIEVT
jgi:hypothetical protein